MPMDRRCVGYCPLYSGDASSSGLSTYAATDNDHVFKCFRHIYTQKTELAAAKERILAMLFQSCLTGANDGLGTISHLEFAQDI
jgi:hypothetical protein